MRNYFSKIMLAILSATLLYLLVRFLRFISDPAAITALVTFTVLMGITAYACLSSGINRLGRE